jgi:N-acetylneuraminic acid mutarotase
MLGVYDFCGHYEWTFAWLEKEGGPGLLHEYWDEAIHQDSQRHATELISLEGIDGMKKYWGHALSQEGAGYTTSATTKIFRLDIHDCPSKGFLIRNGLEQHADYCDHCVGWIGPMLKKAGFAIDHQHNHCGQCWWEMRSKYDESPPGAPGEVAGPSDIRHDPRWNPATQCLDTFFRTNHVEQKVQRSARRKVVQPQPGWEAVAPLPHGIGNAVCGAFGDDVVVAGGITWKNGNKIWLRDVLVFQAERDAWIWKEPLPEPIAYCAFCQTNEGLHFAGGGDGTSTIGKIFRLDQQFELHQTGSLPQALALSGAAETGGTLYIAGGVTDIAHLETSSDVFHALNLADSSVERLPAFPGGNIIVPAAAALKGRIYIFGGAPPGDTPGQVVNSGEALAYSINDGQWRRVAPLPFSVRGSAACVLNNRHILIAGGYTDRFSADCLIYDIETDRYSKTLPLPHGVMPSLVRAGKYVYCIGGEDKMKHRSPNCYRIEWRKLLESGS